MGKGVRHRAVKRQFGANADADNHETKLVVERKRQHAAQIIFNDSEKYREQGHHHAEPDQHMGAGKTESQHVNGELRGKRAQDNGAGDARLGIGILQPAIDKWKSGFDGESQKHKCAAQRFHRQGGDGDAAARADQHHRTGQQNHA